MFVINGLENLKTELIAWRRDFHKFPESGWLEYRTSSKIADILEKLGYNVYVGRDVCDTSSRLGLPEEEVFIEHEKRALSEGSNPKWINLMKGGHTGVAGVLKTKKKGPVIALRFDIDSLAVNESKSNDHLPMIEGFRSLHDGMMHACGHDGHISIGLGVAKLLAENKEKLAGEIRLLFQPAEEGCRGAMAMVNKGWLDGVDFFYSGHIAFQSFTLGEVVLSVGGFLSTTKMDVFFKGKASHAGDRPEEGKNALLAASSASIHLHGISRHSRGKTRINVGLLRAGSSRNVIPDYAMMAIETRGETSELNEYMTNEAIRIIESAAKMYNVDVEWKIVGKASGAKSDTEFMLSIKGVLNEVAGVKKLISYKDLNASEDVAYMINKVQEQGGKASYLLFGSPIKAGHHQSAFDFDENVLSIGSEVLVRLVFASIENA